MRALLQATGLSKHFAARDGGGIVRAVNEVSLAVDPGSTFGIVGESGCGKSTLARLLMRLIEPSEGSITFQGEDFMALGAVALRRRRRDLQMVFQDPYASLDSRMTVGAIISEPLDIHRIGTKSERSAKVRDLLQLVGLEASATEKYPHEFSGGQRQRIGIARAVALEPKLVVLDEPVSALDVSIQSQILNLLIELKDRLALSYIFISHDLSVVEHVSDKVAVMYAGRIVETGAADLVFQSPCHPYTKALVSAVPEIDAAKRRQRIVLGGDPPNPEKIPGGCAFHPRCPFAMPICAEVLPELRHVEGRNVACHLYPNFVTPAQECK